MEVLSSKSILLLFHTNRDRDIPLTLNTKYLKQFAVIFKSKRKVDKRFPSTFPGMGSQVNTERTSLLSVKH